MTRCAPTELSEMAKELDVLIRNECYDEFRLLQMAENCIVLYNQYPSGDLLQVIIYLIRASSHNDWTVYAMDALYHLRSITHITYQKRTCVHYPKYRSFDSPVTSSGISS